MDSTTFQVAPEVLTPVLQLIKLLIAKKFAVTIGSTLAIGVMTYGLLNLFMFPGLQFKYNSPKLEQHTSEKFKTSLLLIFLSALPLVAAIAPLFASFRRPAFAQSIKAIMIALGISAALCWILSRRLAKYMRIKGKQFLVVEAFTVIFRTISENVSEWITKVIMWIINAGIKIVHRPFILEYAIVAVILNLIFSFILIGIIGISQESGYTNVLGSLVGGTAHWMLNRKKIAALRQKYSEEYERGTA